MKLAERLENAKRIAIEVEFCGLCGRQGGFSFGEELNDASSPVIDLILVLWAANAGLCVCSIGFTEEGRFLS